MILKTKYSINDLVLYKGEVKKITGFVKRDFTMYYLDNSNEPVKEGLLTPKKLKKNELSEDYLTNRVVNDVFEMTLEYKQRFGLSITQLANKLGVGGTYISQLFSGQKDNMYFRNMVRMGLALDLVPRVLFTRVPEISRPQSKQAKTKKGVANSKKIDPKEYPAILQLLKTKTTRKVSEMYGVSWSTINKIKKNANKN